MDLANFLSLQDELWKAFGWLARWWLILFAFGGLALSALMVFLSTVSNWLDNK